MFEITPEIMINKLKDIKKEIKSIKSIEENVNQGYSILEAIKIRLNLLEEKSKKLESFYGQLKDDAINNNVEIKNHPAFGEYRNCKNIFMHIIDKKEAVYLEYQIYLLSLRRTIKDNTDCIAKMVNKIVGKFSFSPKAKAERALNILKPELSRIKKEYMQGENVDMFQCRQLAFKMLQKCADVVDITKLNNEYCLKK